METGTTRIIAWVTKAIEGDQAAYKQLYDQWANSMFNICVRMTANRAEAEDIIQESFIKAFENLKQLKDKAMFAGWLRKIVITTCLQHIRNRPEFRELEDVHETADEDDGWLPVADHKAVHEAIKNLPGGCRQIFLLYVSEDYTHKEIAALLNISESTSKSQYLRAKKLLKDQLIASNG